MRFAQVLRNGALSGAAAGLVAALLMWLHTEPIIRRALAIEDARHSSGDHHHDEELVSRTAQVAVGACTAVVAGVLFGLVFAVVFARTRHRLPGRSDHARALWLAAFGFGVFALLPALAIPANPPAVGDADTVTRRTLIYLLAILVGLLVVGAVSAIDRLLQERGTQPPVRHTVDLVSGVVLAALALWLLPSSPDAIPADVPAALVWDFRLASLAQLAAMWSVMGAVFGLLATRQTSPAREAEPATVR